MTIHVGINIAHHLQGYSYPYTTFLYYPNDRFADFFRTIEYFRVNIDQEGTPSYVTNLSSRPLSNVYSYVFYRLIRFTGVREGVLYGYYICILAIFAIVARRLGNKFIVIILAIVSYPVITALDRGNFALLITIMLLFALSTDRIAVSTALIGASVSMRLTPVVFFLPLVFRQSLNIKNVAKAVTFATLWTLIISDVSIWFIENYVFNGAHVLPDMVSEINNYEGYYVGQLRGLAFGSSALLPLRVALSEVPFLSSYASAITPMAVPAFVFGVIGLILLVRGQLLEYIQRSFEFEPMLFIISISFMLFMPVTGDYYLTIFFIPLLFFPKNSYTLPQVIVCALLIAPKNLFFLDTLISFQHISWQVFINPVLLLILLLAEFDLGLPSLSNQTSPHPSQVTEVRA